MSDRVPAIKVLMLPRDTNPMGTIFGGVILSHLDLAGGVEARKHSKKRVVTKAMREVDFVAPVYVGDTVSFFTRTVRLGRTSITIEVEVEAERCNPEGNRETVRVTAATLVYVAVDNEGEPTPVVDS